MSRTKQGIAFALAGSIVYPLMGCFWILLCIPAGIVGYAVARLFLQDVEGPGPAFVEYVGYFILAEAHTCFVKPVTLWKEVSR